jgi:hypothetical protein
MIDYFAATATPEEAVLRRIKGNYRRSFVQSAIEEDGLDSIPPAWTAHAISENLASFLQRQHPRARGGEDLPDLADDEVEIARMTLANSVHGEVSSLRARSGPKTGEILFQMVDEYEQEIQLRKKSATAPPTAEEVVLMFRDCEPSQTDTDCEMKFQSFFYPDIDDIAKRMGIK